MFESRLSQLAVAVGMGIATGIYVFKPLLEEYEQETNGTWIRPGDAEKIKAFHNKETKKD